MFSEWTLKVENKSTSASIEVEVELRLSLEIYIDSDMQTGMRFSIMVLSPIIILPPVKVNNTFRNDFHPSAPNTSML